MQSLRYGLGDYECHMHAAIFAFKCLYGSNHRGRRQAPFFFHAAALIAFEKCNTSAKVFFECKY